MISMDAIPIVAVIICSISQVCLSRELPLPPLQLEPKNASEIQALRNNLDKAADAAFQIGEILRNYSSQLPNTTDSISALSGKKAAIQDETDLTGGLSLQAITGWTTVDLVPYLLDNVLTPIIKRVYQNGSLYYAYWNGSPSTSTAAPEPTKPASSAAPGKRRMRTRKPSTTTAAPETTTQQNGGRDLLEENGQETTAATPNKTKYRVRIRDRPSSSTSTTRKPIISYVDDDEDESKILNKISNL